jgi:hypothetical protein
VLIFVIGENSGWIFARLSPSFDGNFACHFIKDALVGFKASNAVASMTSLTTPHHWAFCIEGNPDNVFHRFSKFCANNNIERRIATVVPTEIPVVQKGWPGMAPRSKTKRQRRLASPEPSKEAASDFLPNQDPRLG